jgi:sRNA-binding carbon storage regulator CsrA
MRFTKHGKLRGLVLKLKEGTVIAVNNGELRVEIVEVKGKYIKLCFQATKDISIKRDETP